MNSSIFIERVLAAILSESALAGAICVDLDPRYDPIMTWVNEADESIPIPIDFPSHLMQAVTNELESIFSAHETLLSEKELGLHLQPEDNKTLVWIVNAKGKVSYWVRANSRDGSATQFNRLRYIDESRLVSDGDGVGPNSS